MSYNMKELPQYINTAGKITVITALFGVVVFAVAFLLNLGANELQQVKAQDQATTTVTVLNTPPVWTVDAQELVESSTSTPTNSGTTITWTARATDSNAESYYLIICSASTTPTANAAAVPTCGAGSTRWAVSSFTASGATSTAATTTTEAAPFVEQNAWVAWVCDAVAVNPRCNSTYKNGTLNRMSPFFVNHRPTFTAFSDNSNAVTSIPGTTVTFSATASDTDVVTVADTVKLYVCSTAVFSTSTDSCGATTIASSTFAASNPTANYSITIPTPDQNYAAFGYLIDIHGHEASGGSQGTNSILTVANATSTVSAAQISLNNGSPLVLTQELGQTTGFSLEYVVTDTNSCENASAGDEIVDYVVSVYRSGVGSSSCDTVGEYNANNCYTSKIATTTWNLSCTASSSVTDCTGTNDSTQTWSCSFPLWYIADPTDGVASNTVYFAENWRAAVSAVDDDSATSSFTQGTTGRELNSFLSFALSTAQIPYGQLEPGQKTDPLAATTTLQATGNVGIDERLTGHSMCTYYTSAVTCNNSATSTIAEYNQVFATSSVTYGYATTTLGNTLSSTTQQELELNVKKSTTTAQAARGITYWGILVPSTITLAGSYTGENTFYAVTGEPAFW